MSVTVVGIGKMGVAVLQRGMLMRVAVRAIGGVVAGIMVMAVVRVGVVVHMIVTGERMIVLVFVPFRQMQP